MTEILLNAVLNLFALQAAVLDAAGRARARDILAAYLSGHLRIARPEAYLDLFDMALDYQSDAGREELLARAGEVAARLKPLLPRSEQHVFLLRCLELAAAAGAGDLEPVRAVAAELAVAEGDLQDMADFCRRPFEAPALSENFLLAGDVPASPAAPCRILPRPGFRGRVCVLRIPEAGVFLVVTDAPDLSLDSLPLPPGTRVLLQPGAILRDGLGNRLYQAELAAAFRRECAAGEFVFRGEHLEFRYPGSDVGLHDFSFCERGGRMVGVMGVSGAGKSTLLSILNGQTAPDSGRVTVNGADLHREPEKVEGVIGFVPQDDLLFEDLTVFENLFYAAGLCLAHLSPEERARRVDAILEELHQPAIRDLKVGSPLEKTISGGQRKRLNIALELIREPSVLFVDEPTSGLSSADSENVMALLKAQAAKGRLVVAVIHQPSSRIYKMFDTLWILDQGGRPIWDGNPLDAIVHFRTAVHQAGMEEYACPHCGGVNPEQLFEIIEARAVNESGRYTKDRLISPQAWHELYLKKRRERPAPAPAGGGLAPPERRLWRPGPLGQLGIFFLRTLKGRLANRQYLFINLVEPPLLALLAALISRGAWGGDYLFGRNANISTYFFISVVVALFMGLSVSAEEINRDRKILKRERFLHLSWPCYVAAKALFLTLVAALQTALFTLVGNSILKVPDMDAFTWATLFTCAVCSSVLGLNISASFRSAVTIYILIPLILVPQMMLGGAVVPFDELIHRAAGTRSTPLAADLMPSRWGYEALLVEQFTGNRYMRPILEDRCASLQADYLADAHIPEARALADYPLLDQGRADPAGSAQRLAALRNELAYLSRASGVEADVPAADLDPARYDAEAKARVKDFLKAAAAAIRARGREASDRVLAADDALRKELGAEGFEVFQDRYRSKDVSDLALNVYGLEQVRLSGRRLVQSAVPVCQPVEDSFGAHFLARAKRWGPWTVPTQLADLAVLWLMTGALYAALYLSLLPRLMALGGRLRRGLRKGRGRKPDGGVFRPNPAPEGDRGGPGMNMRMIVLLVGALLLLPAVDCPAAGDNLQESAQKLLDAYGQGKLAEAVKAMDRLKAAGLSFQPSLVAPAKNVAACKDEEGLRVLHGIYFFDTNYAALFGKKQEFLNYRNEVTQEIHKRLPHKAQWGEADPADPAVLKRYLENPSDPARRDALLASLNKGMDSKIRLAATDPEVMEYLVEFFYGMVLEGAYVTLSLAQDEKLGPEMAAVFNQQAADIDQFDLVLDSFKDPMLLRIMEVSERDPLVDSVRDFILQKKGVLTGQDVKALLAKIKPVRDGFVKVCK